jgi:ABC-type transporter Mla subunit MlaD
MPRERNAFKAGLFILISALLAMGVIVAISGTDALFTHKQQRVVLFSLHEDIGGLQPGDPVRIGGYSVGTVRSIDIVEGRPAGSGTQPHTEVTITLPTRYVFRQDAVAQIDGTLIGASWLNFDNLGHGDPLPAGAPIAGRAGGLNATFQQIYALMPRLQQTIAVVNDKTLPALNADLAKFGATADAFTRVAGTGNQVIANLGAKIDPLAEQVHTVAGNASSTLLQIKDLAHHADTDVLPNVAAASATLKEKLPGLLDQTGKLLAQGTKSLDAAYAALIDVKATFANANTLTGTAKDVIAGNKSKLEGMINSLKTTADNLKSASVEIRHSPWRLIYKPGPQEMANLNVYDAARAFAEGAASLKESAQALRDARAGSGLTDDLLKPLLQKLDSSFEKFNLTEDRLWHAVRE